MFLPLPRMFRCSLSQICGNLDCNQSNGHEVDTKSKEIKKWKKKKQRKKSKEKQKERVRRKGQGENEKNK